MSRTTDKDFLRRLAARNAEHRTDMKSIGEALKRRVANANGLSPEARLRHDAPYPQTDGTQPCATVDTMLFFEWASRETEPICHSCPFLTPCYEYALTHDLEGVWAGTTEGFRKTERTRLNITAIYQYGSLAS